MAVRRTYYRDRWNEKKVCVVMIMDDGFEVKHGYDGWYEMDMFYSDERSEEQYQKAKEHLIRLLRKKRKVATA